jgi:hypothetical protein
VRFTNSVEDKGKIERGGVLLNMQMGKTHILIRLLWMYFPWNWEFSSALLKLRNFVGSLNPPNPHRYATDRHTALFIYGSVIFLPDRHIYWNIQYKSLLTLRYTKHTTVIAFADDVIIMIKADSIREAENITSVELSKISKWADNNKIRFNERKLKVILLTRRKRKERQEIDIHLNDKTLTQVQCIKYLGIIFDYKLTFKEHIKYMAEKCTKLIFTLSKSAKLYWGLGHTALKTVYTGGILPILPHGAPVWKNTIYKASHKAKLTRVQRLINIKIAKAYRPVSNEAVCIITGLTPITIKIQEASQLYQLTISNRGDEVLYDRTIGVKDWQYPAETVTILTDINK